MACLDDDLASSEDVFGVWEEESIFNSSIFLLVSISRIQFLDAQSFG